ncbi:MAG: glycosyltransferase, partial [Actinomycetes bacterium]
MCKRVERAYPEHWTLTIPAPDDSPLDDPSVEELDVDTFVDDDAEEDRKWGLGPAEPLVGYGAPPVVAVIVTRDGGEWFAGTCESLAAQDYENLQVLVIDYGGEDDPTSVIADSLPSAFVKRLDVDRGYSAAANEVLSSVEGAPFILFLHDDVRLEPSAVTELVAEAFRANAGVVGPKIVDWDDPTMLRSVGLSVDPYGFASEVAEPGEIDQSQHDLPREVFAVSGACVLVRADLFAAIEGFSESIPYFGEDTDLCWRAHIAGATVQFCPRAVVAHRGRFVERRHVDDPERPQLQHQARAMLANYTVRRLLIAAPVAFGFSLLDLLGSLVLGRFTRAGDIVAAWGSNLVAVPSLLRDRRRTAASRRVSDASYLPLMRQGSSRIRTLVRGAEEENRLLAATQAGRSYLRSIDGGNDRTALVVTAVVATVALIGGRSLLTGPLPVFREFVDLGRSGPQLIGQWWTAWRAAGLGESSVPPG